VHVAVPACPHDAIRDLAHLTPPAALPPTGGPVGYLLDGSPVVGSGEGGSLGGLLPESLVFGKPGRPALVGYALDGFPIMAEQPWPTPQELDECHGRYGVLQCRP
jgi:hypothetical protein